MFDDDIFASSGFQHDADPAAQHPRLVLTLDGDDWELVDFGEDQIESIRAFISGDSPDRVIRATVPGDVHADLERVGRLPEMWFGTNSRQADWVPRRTWCYRKKFPAQLSLRDRQVWIEFAGINYAAEIWLNGQHIGRHEGQFTAARLDVTRDLHPDAVNTLVVVFERAPQSILDTLYLPRTQENRQLAMDQVTRTLKFWKSRTMSGWDWGTPIWTMGLWRGVQLVATKGVLLESVTVLPELSAPYDVADLHVTIRIYSDRTREVEIHYAIECVTARAPGIAEHQPAELVSNTHSESHTLHLGQPKLWWPNGHGAQHLYDLRVTVNDAATGQPLDTLTTRFGVRDLQTVANPQVNEPFDYHDHWTNQPNDVWQVQGVGSDVKKLPPGHESRYQMVMNGRKIFARGANWLPVDLLFGRVTQDQLEHLVRLAAMGHYNIFRVWGGGLIESQFFYDLCDRYGIMVWQEMPHAGRRPLETDDALERTATEQREIMLQLMNHPSLVRYGFGNELYLDRDDSRQVAQFEDICAELDPSRPAQSASPVTKDQRHGPHWFGFESEYAVYNSGFPLSAGPANPAEWCEYGASGASSMDTLRRILPQSSLWPISDKDDNWRWHNGFGAYLGDDWLMPEVYHPLFGSLPDLATEVRVSQWAQAEGLRYANQSHRRAKWHRSGCYAWTFNEPWPNAAHGCVVEYFGAPKMAYYYARSSYAPIDISARYDQLGFPVSQVMDIEIFMTSDQPDTLDHCTLTALLVGLDGRMFGEKQNGVTVEPDCTTSAGPLGMELPPDAAGQVVLLHLSLVGGQGDVLSEQTYTYFAYTDRRVEAPLRSLLTAPHASLVATVRARRGRDHSQWGVCYQIMIANHSDVPALFVAIVPTDDNRNVYVTNSHKTLMPRAVCNVDVYIARQSDTKHELCISAWNAPILTVVVSPEQL